MGTDPKHFDFGIALGTVLSGGSGLGILGNPGFAWLCGIITAASVVLTAAKSSYNWPEKSKFCLDQIEANGKLTAKYENLVDDINYTQRWTDDFEKVYISLRNEAAQMPQDPYPPLSIALQREIQNGIKARIPYGTWWRPAS